MTTETAKMIYSDKQIALDIMGKMHELDSDKLYDLFQLPHGWQIVRVTKCPKFMPKEIPVPVNWKKKMPKEDPALMAAMAPLYENGLEELKDATKPVKPAPLDIGQDTVTLTLKVKKQSPEWFHLAEPLPNSSSVWLAKASLVSFTQLMDATPGVPTFEFTVSAKFAKKKGWVK